MATYEIPPKAGKFIVVVASGGHFAVWNRKEKEKRVWIPVKTKKQADAVCAKINRGDHNGKISVV